jgi:hypothetical protein
MGVKLSNNMVASEPSNLNICFYHCLIFTLIFHLKVLINFFLFFFIIVSTTTTTNIIITITITIIVVLLIIIYTINLSVIQPRSFRVIYYCDTPALGIRHQLFDRVKFLAPLPGR